MPEIKKESPFAINFRKLQRYNFSFFPNIEIVILFEYFMVLAQTFGYKQFYHSTSMIVKDTGIKRTRIENAITFFCNNEIMSIEIKGFPLVKHFIINVDKLIPLLPDIYQFAENSKLHDEINKLYAEIYKQFAANNSQENINTRNNKKETNEETKEKKRSELANAFFLEIYTLQDAYNFILSLEDQYNNRRKYLATKNNKKYPKATLGHKNNTMAEIVCEAINQIDKEVIENAWLVFIDKIEEGELTPNRLLPYFFTKKEGEFDVISAMADIHNTAYTFTK